MGEQMQQQRVVSEKDTQKGKFLTFSLEEEFSENI